MLACEIYAFKFQF